MDALDRGERDEAMKLAESNQSVAGLAALLHATDAETRRRLLGLVRQIEAGELSFDDAIAGAREVNAAKISTINDVIKNFNKIIAAYVYNAKKVFRGMRSSVRAFREYANFKTTDAMLQNQAMLKLLKPNLDVLGVKTQMLKTVGPEFSNKTRIDLIHTQEISSEAVDVAEAALRDAKDLVDAAGVADRDRERKESRLVEDKTKAEKQWVTNLVAKTRGKILQRVSFLQQANLVDRELKELVRRARRANQF